MKTKLLTLTFILLILSGCNVSKELAGAYNITQCKYDYNSISAITFAGMDLSNGISPLQIPKITSLLTGTSSSIPLDFTVNLDVSNPNSTNALLHGLQYIFSIDGVQFTTGTVNQSLNVPAGGKQILPLSMGFDIATFMKGESHTAVQNIVKNFIGIGDSKSKVTLQIKPSFTVAGRTVTSPSYIPIQFSFGGK